MSRRWCVLLGLFSVGVLLLAVVANVNSRPAAVKETPAPKEDDNHEWALPNDKWKAPFADEQPIYFVNRNQNATEWEALKNFWNPVTEKVIDSVSGKTITRKAVKIKVPLGLNSNPLTPLENPMTVAKWK